MQVFVKTHTASTFAIIVKPYATVKDLKKLIQDVSKIPVQDFSLKFGPKNLADHLLLSFYNVKEGSVIQLIHSKTEAKAKSGTIKSLNSFTYQSKSTKNPLKGEMENLTSELLDAIKNSFSQSQLSEVGIEYQVNSIENCNEQNTVILGTDEGTIIYYDYVKKQVIKTLAKNEDGITRITCSGTNILAAGTPKGVYVYREGEAKQIAQTQESVTILQITKEGEFLFYKKGENMIEKYRIPQMSSACVFNYEVPVNAIALFSNEQKIAIGGSNTEIKIFSVNNPSEAYVIPNSKQGTVIMLKMTSDDKHLVAVYKERFIKVYNLELETCHTFRHTHSSKISAIALTSKNKIMFSGARDGSLVMYDLEKLAIIHYSDDFLEGGIRSLQVSSDEKTLLAGGNNKNLMFFDLEPGNDPYQVPMNFDSITCLANHSKVTHFIVGGKDGSIQSFDHVNGTLDRSITVEAGQVYVVATDQASSNLVAAAFEDQSIRVFDSTSERLISKFEAAHKDQITGLVFSKDAKALISSSIDESLKVWNLETSTPTPTSIKSSVSSPSLLDETQKILPEQKSTKSTANLMYIDVNSHTDPIGCIRLSADGKHLVTASWGRRINVFEFSQIYGKDMRSVQLNLIHTFADAHDGLITSVVISSDNKYIVSAGSDLKINMFDLERRRFVCTIVNSHKGVPKWLNLTEDNQYVISVDELGGVCFFSITARKQVHFDTIPNSSEIAAAILTHNSQQIITADTDGKINVTKNALLPGIIKISFGSVPATSNLGFCFLEYFIRPTITSRKRLELISHYPNLYIHPFEWNFLHIVAIFAPSIELIDACIKEKVPFKKDNRGYTPLHYLLHATKKDVTAVNYLLAKFGELIQDSMDLYPVIRTLSNQLPEIVKYGSFQAANFLEQALLSPQTFGKNSLTCFGSLKSVKRKFVISESSVFTPEIKEQLVGPDGEQMLSVKMVGFRFDYSSSSNDMLNFLLFLNDLDNEEIYKAGPISKLVDYLWYKNSLFFYIPTLIYSSVMIVLSVYCGMSFEDRPFGLEVAIMALGGVSFLYEFWLLISEVSLYFKDQWNIVDMIVNLLLMACCITFWTTESDSLASRSLLTATLFFGYIRWISYFRVIDQTRKLTGMIAEVLLDMRSFLFVLIFLCVGFAFIFFQLKPTSSFSTQLLYTYNLIYANYDDGPQEGEIFYFVVFTVLVSVVLLNLLIAIMNETYSRVQNMEAYYDSKTRVSLAIEAITAKRFILKITSVIRKSGLWRLIFCPKRFLKTGLAKLHPETIMRVVENEFTVKTGHLYYVEEIKREEYEKVMKNTNQGEGKKGEMDLESLLKEEVGALKEKFENTLDQNNKEIKADINRIEDKLNMLIKMMKEKEDSKLKTK